MTDGENMITPVEGEREEEGGGSRPITTQQDLWSSDSLEVSGTSGEVKEIFTGFQLNIE